MNKISDFTFSIMSLQLLILVVMICILIIYFTKIFALL